MIPSRPAARGSAARPNPVLGRPRPDDRGSRDPPKAYGLAAGAMG